MLFLPILFTLGVNMSDPKLAEAYQMALQMDKEQDQENESIFADTKQRFLKAVSGIESSGGLNTNHKRIKHGIHAGHKAGGRYGIMPNTMLEVINRFRQEGRALPEGTENVYNMTPDEITETINTNGELERVIADYLAEYVLKKQKDPEKAAYSWTMGHNLEPDVIDKRDYKNADYVKKFRKYFYNGK